MVVKVCICMEYTEKYATNFTFIYHFNGEKMCERFTTHLYSMLCYTGYIPTIQLHFSTNFIPVYFLDLILDGFNF